MHPFWFGTAWNSCRGTGAQEENILLHILTDSYELHQLILHHHHLLFSNHMDFLPFSSSLSLSVRLRTASKDFKRCTVNDRSLIFCFSSFFFLFLPFSFTVLHVAKENSALQLPLALCYHSLFNDSSGIHMPQIPHSSHALSLPSSVAMADFHAARPAWKPGSNRRGWWCFLLCPPSV